MSERVSSLEPIIRRLLEERFTGVVIDDVIAKSGFDSDGDGILKITVVLGSEGALDRKELVGFVRHLRSTLENEHVAEFPIVSFVSKSEAHKLKLETA